MSWSFSSRRVPLAPEQPDNGAGAVSPRGLWAATLSLQVVLAGKVSGRTQAWSRTVQAIVVTVIPFAQDAERRMVRGGEHPLGRGSLQAGGRADHWFP